MTPNWRKELCRCDDCIKLYDDQNVSFLIDEEDTVHHYESQAKNEGTLFALWFSTVCKLPNFWQKYQFLPGSQYEKGMEALSAMDRVKQVEAIQSYNSMKANLMEYLKKFAQSGKVVREEDVKEFFEQMKSVKRPRLEIPDNCR